MTYIIVAFFFFCVGVLSGAAAEKKRTRKKLGAALQIIDALNIPEGTEIESVSYRPIK